VTKHLKKSTSGRKELFWLMVFEGEAYGCLALLFLGLWWVDRERRGEERRGREGRGGEGRRGREERKGEHGPEAK
jgi:hypothetical protein